MSARRAGTRGAETVERALSVVIQILDDGGEANLRLAEVSRRSHVSIGSLYHHFPGGMEELAEAALEASAQAVADALREALDGAPNAALGVARFIDVAKGPVGGETCPGCPIAPTALESPIISPRLRTRRAASTNGKL